MKKSLLAAALLTGGILTAYHFFSKGRTPEAHFLAGNERFAAGDYPAALRRFDKALPGNENNPGLQLNRGMTLEKLGRMDESLKAYHASLQLNPADPRPYESLARLYAASEPARARVFETIGAIHAGRSTADFPQLAALVANVSTAHKLEGYSLMAFAFFKFKRIPEAQRAWQAALTLQPNQPGVLMNLFLTLERSDPSRAAAYLRQYVALAETDPQESPKLEAARRRLQALEEKMKSGTIR